MRKREIQRSVKRSLKGIARELRRIEQASSDMVDSLLRVEIPGDDLGACVRRAVTHCQQDMLDKIVAKNTLLQSTYQFRNYGKVIGYVIS